MYQGTLGVGEELNLLAFASPRQCLLCRTAPGFHHILFVGLCSGFRLNPPVLGSKESQRTSFGTTSVFSQFAIAGPGSKLRVKLSIAVAIDLDSVGKRLPCNLVTES